MSGLPAYNLGALVAAVACVAGLVGVFMTLALMPRQETDGRLDSFQGCARTAVTVAEAQTCNRHLERAVHSGSLD